MRKEIQQDLGQLVNAGFHGTTIDDEGVQIALEQVRQGKLGGIVLYRYNIVDPAQLSELISQFKSIPSKYPLFVMLDQEGGKVQRVGSQKGFIDSLSAQKVAQTLTPDQAYDHYREMGAMLQNIGFNYNFAPCVDVDGDPSCPVIGKLERSYSDDAKTVAAYASAMVRALREHGVVTSLKHFPGHGSAREDSHMGLVNITDTWSEDELVPYRLMNESGMIDSVMSAHLIHNSVEADTPVVFSDKWISRLRKDIGFKGPIITDDLHMGAIVHNFSVKEIVTRTINAGHDLLLFSNNPLASQSGGIRHDENQNASVGSGARLAVPDPQIAEKVIAQITESVEKGDIQERQLEESIARITTLKKAIK